ncbi:MAG: YraN family protein [Clostridiales bacterium]|nr:YraN family protein [Clostridiales bacterium]
MNTRIVGRRGEDSAIDYLKTQGYIILDRNYSCKMGEIDVVAWDGEFVVFIEVKSRKDTAFGLPREAVDWRKQKTIVKVAEYWLYKNKRTGFPVRFDVVELLAGHVNHLVDAFRP